MKAWFLFPKDDRRGYVVHAETRGKAKVIGMKFPEYFDLDVYDWPYLYAKRFPKLDDKPITIQSLIDTGLDMTFEGEPIDTIDLECPCKTCRNR